MTHTHTLSLSLSLSLSLLISIPAFASEDDFPLGPGGEGEVSIGEWIPIGQPGEDPTGSCGEWSWDSGRPKLMTQDPPALPSPFSFPIGGRGSWGIGFEQSGADAKRALVARCALRGPVVFSLLLGGATFRVPSISAGAERSGFLRWRAQNPAAPNAPVEPQRVRLVSTGKVETSAHLDHGLVFAGEVTRMAGGTVGAELDTRGSGLGTRISARMAASKTFAKLSEWAFHSSQPQASSLGFGLTLGVENGGSAEVGWQMGGTQAGISMSEFMRCIEWDCVQVTPTAVQSRPGEREWFFEQIAFVWVGAELVRGQEVKVQSKVVFEDFQFERQQCPCLDGVTGGGLGQHSGSGGGGSSGGGG
jgi:hypothetical protein